MYEKKILKYLTGLVVLAVLIKLISAFIAEPLLRRQFETKLNEKNKNFIIGIGRVRISMIPPGIKLEMIRISSIQKPERDSYSDGEISSIKFKGIHLLKALFKKNIDISEVIISSSVLRVNIPFPEEPIPSILSSQNIRIGKVLFNKIDLVIKNTLNAQSFSVKKGVLIINDFKVEKKDTLSPGIIKQFDFESEELQLVSADSMYTIKADTIDYYSTSTRLGIRGFTVHPNYTEYGFTERYKYQKDRIEVRLSAIYLHNFSAYDFLKSRSLESAYIEIGKMDLDVFRDGRKEIRHVSKPSLQDLIYNYAGTLRIDSINLKSGNITYTLHRTDANEPGRVSFNEINVKIYKITNDTVYKTKNASLEFKGKALLMKKGRMTFSIKAKLFDRQNTFSLNGTLSDLEGGELNPMLEKNAFVYVTSGKIDTMSYSFTANNAKASGRMTLLYHGLDLTVKNKRTDDTTALKERIGSFFANKKVIDSNPVPGEDVREGIIYYERDPEKSFFGYCFNSIFSGIKATIVKSPQKKT